MSQDDLIGKRILSPKFGIGIIESIEQMGGRDFFVAFSQELNIKNFVPVDDQTEYRFLSSKKDLEQCLKNLSPSHAPIEFESKQERINYFKTETTIQNLEKITFLLCELAAIDDRGTVEEASLAKLIETLSIELSIVLEISRAEATKQIKENLGI